MTDADPLLKDVRAAVAGDRAAFERVLRSTARLVFSTVLLQVRDPHLAEDLTQETYLRAWRSIEQLNEPGRFKAWLLNIARSVCVDAHRRQSRKKRTLPSRSHQRVETSAAIDPADAAPDPFERLSQSDERDRLLAALKDLPEPQQTVLAMRYLAGADFDTIAEQLSLTDGALRGLLYRGLTALRERLAPEQTASAVKRESE